MNERIKELAEQAGMVRGGYANTPEKIMTWREHFDNPGALEKFAELIVKECIFLMQNEMQGEEDISSDWVFDKIVAPFKKHFGVE